MDPVPPSLPIPYLNIVQLLYISLSLFSPVSAIQYILCNLSIYHPLPNVSLSHFFPFISGPSSITLWCCLPWVFSSRSRLESRVLTIMAILLVVHVVVIYYGYWRSQPYMATTTAGFITAGNIVGRRNTLFGYRPPTANSSLGRCHSQGIVGVGKAVAKKRSKLLSTND